MSVRSAVRLPRAFVGETRTGRGDSPLACMQLRVFFDGESGVIVLQS